MPAEAEASSACPSGAHAHFRHDQNPATIYQASFNGSWEIDIWGRLRRLTEARQGRPPEHRGGPPCGDPHPGRIRGEQLRESPGPGQAAGDRHQHGEEPGGLVQTLHPPLRSRDHFRTGALAGKVRVRTGTGQNTFHPEADHPAGERPLRAARQEPGAHSPREEHRRTRPACRPRRAPVRSSRTAPRHPPGRAGPHCGQREDRCGQGPLLPDHLPDRCSAGQASTSPASSRVPRRRGHWAGTFAGPVFTGGAITGNYWAQKPSSSRPFSSTRR